MSIGSACSCLMLAMLLLSLDMLCTTCTAQASMNRNDCTARQADPNSACEQFDVAVLKKWDDAAEEADVAHVAGSVDVRKQTIMT